MNSRQTLILEPCPSGASLAVRKENGNTIVFHDPEQAHEFMFLVFGMDDNDILEYWEEVEE